MSSPKEKSMSTPLIPLTFDDLASANLDQVYQQGREEVLRDQAFSILLARADTVVKLEQLVFAGEQGLTRWSRKELIEISNRFRLLSSPENEIRLYRECEDEAFRQAPRVREFYVLALNRLGRPAEAIQEASRLIAEGGRHALLWGVLGEAYSARMLFAEELAQALTQANGVLATLDPQWITRCANYFPNVALAELTVARARALREENLRSATRMFRRGFRESGSSFTGLGWLLRTIDHLTDLIIKRGHLQQKRTSSGLDEEEALDLRLVDSEIRALEREMDSQILLIDLALTVQGGLESLDYWTNAGALLLQVVQGADPAALRPVLARLFATVDAEFKLATTLAELRRIRDRYSLMRQVEHAQGRASTALDLRINCAAFALAECEAGLARFKRDGRVSGRRPMPTNEHEHPHAQALAAFLDKTINFHALTGTLVPVCISGSIGRVGARVPDLVINRRVQEDLADLVETKVLQPLPLAERENPRAVIARIQQVVGAGLKVGDLQDLQSPAHHAFDLRSNGLIALAGVDEDLRRHTRTTTDLTATLLLQTGDCRETMYLNGALFACWQQMEVKKRIAKAMLCLDLDYQTGFQTIVEQEIPALLRYQLRGGQVAVYVESIAMRAKYHCEPASATDSTPVLRTYGLADVRAGQPLTRYELETAKLRLTYRDGSTTWIEARDATMGQGRPMDHQAGLGGGVPILPAGAEESITEVRLLNLVEEHAMTFLYDTQQQTVEFCDGFYNRRLFQSPYAFDAGAVDVAAVVRQPGLLPAASRRVRHPDGSVQQHPVYLQFLPFSQTEYESALMEGDIPDTIQLMGRIFRGELKRERRRLEEGTSPLPTLLDKVQRWQESRQRSPQPSRRQLELQLIKLLLDLAREHPELVQLQTVTSDTPLITEAMELHHVYLVLSGQLSIYRHQRPVRDQDGNPIHVMAGGMLGELALLRGGVASATVVGNAVVLRIDRQVIHRQLAHNPTFRQTLEAMAGYRIW
jgi:hypothetical protein